MRITLTSAVLFLGALAPAQNVRITNLADAPRKQWVDVAVPQSDAATLPALCRLDPHGFIVCRGSDVGQHSTMFHVLADLMPSASLTGRIVPVGGAQLVPPHAMTNWVADRTLGVFQVPAALIGGQEHRATTAVLQVVESNAVRTVFLWRGRLGTSALTFEQWLYVYSHQDQVRMECAVTFSDPRTPDLSLNVDLLWLEGGEFLAVDYRERLSMPPPARQTAVPVHPSHGKWIQLLSGPRVIGRGEQLVCTGTVLCLPQTPVPEQPLRYAAGSLALDLTPADRTATLIAASQGPVVGVYLDWAGKWLAFGMTPEVPPSSAGDGGWGTADASFATFQGLLATPADPYVQRPRGLNRYAGTTGAQEDFGACKGAFAVTVGDPRFLYEVGYSVHELFLRPFHHREVDTSPLRQNNHLALRTWGQLVNCRTTGDRLGLNCPYPWSWPSSGWSAYDDQHRSQNNANMLLALGGSHALRAQMRDLAEIDMAQDPGRVDSPRGEGRLHMAWSNMLLLLDDPADRASLRAHMLTRIQEQQNRWLGRNFVNDPQRTVRALATGTAPGFVEPNGSAVPAIIVWEHSIAVMGFFAGWRVTGDPRYRDLAAAVSKTIVDHCVFQENGAWIAATAVRYQTGANEGLPLPASSYYTGSPDISIGVSFWEWIFPSVLICRELHRNDAALVARCDTIVQGLGAPHSWQRSQWWAVLPR